MSQPAILYVEDDPRSRKVMHMLLQGRMGLPHVTILEDSTDFLSQVKAIQPKPDVILLDIQMEPLNGFEMLNLLRGLDEFHHIPVVAVTASVMSEEVELLRQAGFHSCLAKPLNIDTFPETLNRISRGEAVWRIID